MKYTLFLLLISFLGFQAHSQSDNQDSLKHKLNGTWESKKEDHSITFKDNIAYIYHKDSTISKASPCPFTIEDDFIIVNCHPLEQTHYKIIEITDNKMRLNIYWLKLTDKEIIQGKPNSIRLKSKGENRKYIKVKN